MGCGFLGKTYSKMGISNNWTELWTVTVTLEWIPEWIMDYLSLIVSTNFLYRAFVRACIAKRREHSIRVTSQVVCMVRGEKRWSDRGHN